VPTVVLRMDGEMQGITAQGQTWRFTAQPAVQPGSAPQAPAFLAGPAANSYVFVNSSGDQQVFERK